jgi:membrane-associated phospholipid phosphatase
MLKKSLLLIFTLLVTGNLMWSQTKHHWDIACVDKLNNQRIAHSNWIQPYSNSVIYMTATTPILMVANPFFETKEGKWKMCAYELGALSGALLVNNLVTFQMKKAVERARPFDAHPDLIDPAYRPTDYSFPSGHTSGAFQWATTMVLYSRFHYGKSPWWVTVPAFAYAGSIAWSRMAMGVHYPTDVLAGALIGSCSSWLSWKLTTKWYQSSLKRKRGSPST